MGKLDKEQEARMAGMRYALGIAKEKGVDGLQKELQMRGRRKTLVLRWSYKSQEISAHLVSKETL